MQDYIQLDGTMIGYCLHQGAMKPRILNRQPYAAQTMLYIMEADSWASSSQFGAGNVRHFTLWADGQGTINIGEVGLFP